MPRRMYFEPRGEKLLRIELSLLRQVEAYAAEHNLSQTKAFCDLLRRGLASSAEEQQAA